MEIARGVVAVIHSPEGRRFRYYPVTAVIGVSCCARGIGHGCSFARCRVSEAYLGSTACASRAGAGREEAIRGLLRQPVHGVIAISGGMAVEIRLRSQIS